MRSASEKNSSGRKRWVLPCLFSTAIGLSLTAAILTGLSLVLTLQDIPQGMIQPLAIAAMGVGTLLSGYLASRIVGRKGLLVGMLSGFFCCTVLVGISLIITDFSPDIAQGVQLVVALFTSAVGGVLGVNSRYKRRA